jgi:hypothetical protein
MVPNGTPQSLNYIPLRWMIREVIKSGCGVRFDEEGLKRLNIVFDDEKVREEDSEDAIQPLHDELKAAPMWWLLEIVPMKFKYQEPDGTWNTTFRYVDRGMEKVLPSHAQSRQCRWHLGRGRQIVASAPLFHSSVKTRMESSLKYSPNAVWEVGSEKYVS